MQSVGLTNYKRIEDKLKEIRSKHGDDNEILGELNEAWEALSEDEIEFLKTEEELTYY